MNATLKPIQSPDAERSARVRTRCLLSWRRAGLNEEQPIIMTLMVPGQADRFLLRPSACTGPKSGPAISMVVDFSGRVVSGQGSVEDTALYIHQPVHRLSPQGTCVLHTHMPYATALCMLENPCLEMAVQTALGFYEDVAYDLDYNGLAHDVMEGERMARALGDKSVLMLANHGVLVVGKTVPQAFERLYFLERAAQAGAGIVDRASLAAHSRVCDQEDGRAIRRQRIRRRSQPRRLCRKPSGRKSASGGGSRRAVLQIPVIANPGRDRARFRVTPARCGRFHPTREKFVKCSRLDRAPGRDRPLARTLSPWTKQIITPAS